MGVGVVLGLIVAVPTAVMLLGLLVVEGPAAVRHPMIALKKTESVTWQSITKKSARYAVVGSCPLWCWQLGLEFWRLSINPIIGRRLPAISHSPELPRRRPPANPRGVRAVSCRRTTIRR